MCSATRASTALHAACETSTMSSTATKSFMTLSAKLSAGSRSARRRWFFLLIVVQSPGCLLWPAHQRDSGEYDGHAHELVGTQLFPQEPGTESRGDDGIDVAV